MLRQLDLRDRVQMVVLAYETGLVRLGAEPPSTPGAGADPQVGTRGRCPMGASGSGPSRRAARVAPAAGLAID